MSKLGVYIAAHQNPVFLRHCLLQILHQSHLPDVLAIHVNNTPEDYLWAAGEVLGTLIMKGVDVRYQFTPFDVPMPKFFVPPLTDLVLAECDYFIKADYDDLFFEDHFGYQLYLIEKSEDDYAMNVNAGLLVMSYNGGFKYRSSVDFGIWNPTGAHPNNLIFNARVAQEFLKVLADHNNVGINDDKLLADKVLPKFVGRKFDRTPTSCFVAHGRNVSVAHWSYQPPPEVL